jgi:CheY-like chemotaxis protein
MFMHRDRLRGIEIALVDDEVESRKMVAAVLRAAGANLTAFDTATAALAALDQHRPNIVLTDIAMPDMDGYAFTRAMRERGYGNEVKIVALSAFPATGDRASGFDAYLTKPIDPFHLVDEIARIALPATA